MKKLTLLRVLILIAILASSYLIYLHYKPTPSTLCDISKAISCDKVNKSTYAEIFGIPVAIFSLLFFIVAIGASFKYKKYEQYFKIGSVLALAFAMYLLFVSIYILKAFCLFCITIDIIIIISVILIFKKR